jgi:uncharacterized protein (DUF488 family)
MVGRGSWRSASSATCIRVTQSLAIAWLRGYAAYMLTDVFRVALSSLEGRATAGEDLAVMCAETLWWRCHRRLIADALVSDGLAVRHLIDQPPGLEHRISTPSVDKMGTPEWTGGRAVRDRPPVHDVPESRR